MLLLVFALLKIGVAHSLSHTFSHDDTDDCEQCILIVESNKTKTFYGHSNSYTIEVNHVELLTKPLALHYNNPQFRAHHYILFFNKPPPSLHNLEDFLL